MELGFVGLGKMGLSLANGVGVHRVLVRRDQPHDPSACPPVEVPDQLVRRLGRPLADHQTDHRPALRVEGHVVPAVAGVYLVRFAVLLLLGDEVPLLVELHFTRRRGKKRRARRAAVGRGRRRRGRTG